MRSSPAGFAFAEILTFTAESPAPGGHAYRDVMIDKGLGDDFLHAMGILDPDVPYYRWGLPEPLNRIEGNLTLKTPVAELAGARRKSPLPYQR